MLHCYADLLFYSNFTYLSNVLIMLSIYSERAQIFFKLLTVSRNDGNAKRDYISICIVQTAVAMHNFFHLMSVQTYVLINRLYR